MHRGAPPSVSPGRGPSCVLTANRGACSCTCGESRVTEPWPQEQGAPPPPLRRAGRKGPQVRGASEPSLGRPGMHVTTPLTGRGHYQPILQMEKLSLGAMTSPITPPAGNYQKRSRGSTGRCLFGFRPRVQDQAAGGCPGGGGATGCLGTGRSWPPADCSLCGVRSGVRSHLGKCRDSPVGHCKAMAVAAPCWVPSTCPAPC